jgi:hypothetical protein
MEAPAIFKHKNKYYFIASGCTGWDPNSARLAVSNSIWGPWTELKNPCVGKDSDKTFNAQSTYVLQVQDKDDFFIFMADQWHRDNLKDSRYLWLPLKFDDENMVIKWDKEWDFDNFKN